MFVVGINYSTFAIDSVFVDGDLFPGTYREWDIA